MGIDKLMGAVDHETAAKNFAQKISTETDLPLDEMEQIYDDCWDEMIEENGEPVWEKPEEETRALGKRMTHIYHEHVAPLVQPISVENRFELELPGVPVPLIGYVDVETRGALIERKTTKTRLKTPKPGWLMQGRIYSMTYDKPVEWQLITRQAAPQVVLPETEPGLRLENAFADATVKMVQQAAWLLEDLWLRYGPDNPWPLHGLTHPFQCQYCFAGPRYGAHCIAWDPLAQRGPNDATTDRI